MLVGWRRKRGEEGGGGGGGGGRKREEEAKAAKAWRLGREELLLPCDRVNPICV